MEKSINTKLIDANKHIIPSAISTSLLTATLVEVFPELQNAPNTTILLGLTIYSILNNGIVILRSIFKKYL